MNATRRISALAIAFTAAVVLQSHSHAGLITSAVTFSLPGSSTGSLGPLGSTPAPNNDDVTGPSANVIPYSVFFNSQGMLETEFAVSASGGTTEYRFTQSFVNNTGQAWTGFLFELGYGTGASFVPSSAADSLSFDDPTRDPTPTSTFPSLIHESDTLSWSGTTIQPVTSSTYTFAIDVPDLGPNGRFTLRQTPVAVPEPMNIVLLGVGIAVLSVVVRRRSTRNAA